MTKVKISSFSVTVHRVKPGSGLPKSAPSTWITSRVSDAEVWLRESMLDSVDQPGDGSAGGLGAGLRAFCRAERRPGAEVVAELTGFNESIRTADLLVTGEGRTDDQTADGKLPAVLAAKAKMAGVRTLLISGVIRGDVSALDGFFDAMYGAVGEAVSAVEAVSQGRQNLARVAREAAEEIAQDM